MLDAETVVVILHDSLTKAECALVQAGRDAEVLRLRRLTGDWYAEQVEKEQRWLPLLADHAR
jgi:hypothetical protein